MSDLAIEDVRPIPVRRSENLPGRILFGARMAVDLQLLTCMRFLRPYLAQMTGRVLDVGCGQMPYRGMLPRQSSYVGIDIAAAGQFGMSRHPDIVAFDGAVIPFPDATFDYVLCTEVLEHVENPGELIAEMRRVLRPGGLIVATVPFSARVHHAPHDFHRYTRYRLASLFACVGATVIEERGDDLATLANKLIVICMRLARPSRASLWGLALLVALAPIALLALAVAHASLAFRWGSRADPLGYGVASRKT